MVRGKEQHAGHALSPMNRDGLKNATWREL
jgi:hypothetical protein